VKSVLDTIHALGSRVAGLPESPYCKKVPWGNIEKLRAGASFSGKTTERSPFSDPDEVSTGAGPRCAFLPCRVCRSVQTGALERAASTPVALRRVDRIDAGRIRGTGAKHRDSHELDINHALIRNVLYVEPCSGSGCPEWKSRSHRKTTRKSTSDPASFRINSIQLLSLQGISGSRFHWLTPFEPPLPSLPRQ